METKIKSLKIKSFDGTGDVKTFIEKVGLLSSLKGYENEKAAQNLASRLEGRAFDVYMRLDTEHKKKPEKIKAELLEEFECGKHNRELAVTQLSERRRKPDESVQTYAFKIMELTKLAYPAFDDDSMAGIESFANKVVEECCANLATDASQTMVEMVTENVMKQMKEIFISQPGGTVETGTANYINIRSYRGHRGRNQRPFNRNRSALPQNRKCRACKSPDHMVRECPTRFCQACGERGHNSWEKRCPNNNQ